MYGNTKMTTRAGNGTRTRDPNLGKVVLYQLSYSRMTRDARPSGGPVVRLERYSSAARHRRGWDGGEGNRTPDLLNAIQALSQLSYAPRGDSEEPVRQEPRIIVEGIDSVNEMGLAQIPMAGILQRLL